MPIIIIIIKDRNLHSKNKLTVKLLNQNKFIVNFFRAISQVSNYYYCENPNFI